MELENFNLRLRILKRLDTRYYLKHRYILEEAERGSDAYEESIAALLTEFNAMGRGNFRLIDILWLENQFGHLLFYLPNIGDDEIIRESGHRKEMYRDLMLKEKQIPMDIKNIKQLHSHVRNITVIKLRGISKFLMHEHRGLLAELIEMQVRQRSLRFEDMDLSKEVTALERAVMQWDAKARTTKLKVNKLDHFAAALCQINQLKQDYRYLVGIIRDPTHNRRDEAMQWMKNLGYSNIKLLEVSLDLTREKIERIFSEIIHKMTLCSGIPFKDDPKAMEETTFNWYTLGLEVPRNEYFATTFALNQRTTQQLERKTFFYVRTLYDVSYFREQFEKRLPTQTSYQIMVPRLASLFLNVHRAIGESRNPEGEVSRSLKMDQESGIQNAQELEMAEKWARENLERLIILQGEILECLKKAHQQWSDAALPNEVMEIVKKDENQARKRLKRFKAAQTEMPMIKAQLKMLELRAEKEAEAHQSTLQSDISADFDNLSKDEKPTLVQLLELYKLLEQRTPFWSLLNGFSQQSQADAAVKAAEDFEIVLKFETEMDELLKSCEDLIVYYYYNVPYAETYPEVENIPAEDRDDLILVDKGVCNEAFELVLFRNLSYIRQLDYEKLKSSYFEERFKAALNLDEMDGIFMLDRIFHEIRCQPRAEQLIHALSGWEKKLGVKKTAEKESFIIQNNDALKQLMDEIRARLRTKITQIAACPRRLRMEVFGLGDFFAGALEDIFFSQYKTIDKVATPEELKLMIQSIEAIEAQILEAQHWMEKGGLAEANLEKIRNAQVFDAKFIELLTMDLQENAKDLSKLLKGIGEKMAVIKRLKKQIDASKDDDYLEVVIEHKDIKRLHQIYTFMENMAPQSLKRFALAYTRKTQIMDAIIAGKAADQDIEVPPAINAKIDKAIRQQYESKNYISVPLRLAILDQMPIVLEADCRLLAYTLNFVKFGGAHKMAAYMIPIKILKTATEWSLNDERRRAARRYWVFLRDYLNKHEPESFIKNYENNLKAFLIDKNREIGDKLD